MEGRGADLESGGADAQAVGSLFQADAKLALQVLQAQPLARLPGVARPLNFPPRCVQRKNMGAD